jgi:hypothetical protein
MKRRKRRRWKSVLGDWGRGEVKHGVARGVVRCYSMKGGFYRLEEAVEGRGDYRRCSGD